MSVTKYNYRLYEAAEVGNLPAVQDIVVEFSSIKSESELNFNEAISHAIRSLNSDLIIYLLEHFSEFDFDQELYGIISSVEFLSITTGEYQKAIDIATFCYDIMKRISYDTDYLSIVLAGANLDNPLIRRIIEENKNINYVELAEILVHNDTMLHFKKVILCGRIHDAQFDYNILIGHASDNSKECLEIVIAVARDEATDTFQKINFPGAILECISYCEFDNMLHIIPILIQLITETKQSLDHNIVFNEIQIALERGNLSESQAETIRSKIN